MEKQHRDAIQKNFSSLVEQTDLDLMVAALYEKEVFSDAMIEPYKDTSKDQRTRRRQLYRDITRRGPHAFQHLLDALMENGYWDLVRALDPNSSLHPQVIRPVPSSSAAGGSPFLSLFDKKRSSGKEQDDPNRNRDSHSSFEGDRSRTEEEQNGNAETGGAGDVADQTESSIPQFNVVKSIKFFEDNGDIKLYRTRGRLRGVMMLFSYNQFQYEVEEERTGAPVDVDNLKYLFTELGFKTFTYVNLTLQQTKAALEQLKNGICGEGPETVFVVFSSHGYGRSHSGDTDIRCSDNHLISYYEIIDYFNNVKFPALDGTPKVFIFQACRGSNKDFVQKPRPLSAPGATRPRARPGAQLARDLRSRTAQDGCVYREHDDEDETHDQDLEHDQDPTQDRIYSDILIAHSTVPGYTSSRDKISGSWYIQALCSVFAARAHDCHVEKLFTLVDEALRSQFATQTSSVDRWGFNRRLYLHPGLYEDDGPRALTRSSLIS